MPRGQIIDSGAAPDVVCRRMRKLLYLLVFCFGIAIFVAAAAAMVRAGTIYGIGSVPTPQTGLCYLVALVGVGVSGGAVRHWFRANMD